MSMMYLINKNYKQTRYDMKTWKVIRTEDEYKKALCRLEYLMEIEPQNNSPEGDELDLLAVLTFDFETKETRIPELDPIEIIKFFMEEHEYERNDLISVIGDKTLISRILNKKRKLTLEMIRNLSNFFSIPIELLIADYDLVK